jgi:hypothetical protein
LGKLNETTAHTECQIGAHSLIIQISVLECLKEENIEKQKVISLHNCNIYDLNNSYQLDVNYIEKGNNHIIFKNILCSGELQLHNDENIQDENKSSILEIPLFAAFNLVESKILAGSVSLKLRTISSIESMITKSSKLDCFATDFSSAIDIYIDSAGDHIAPVESEYNQFTFLYKLLFYLFYCCEKLAQAEYLFSSKNNLKGLKKFQDNVFKAISRILFQLHYDKYLEASYFSNIVKFMLGINCSENDVVVKGLNFFLEVTSL